MLRTAFAVDLDPSYIFEPDHVTVAVGDGAEAYLAFYAAVFGFDLADDTHDRPFGLGGTVDPPPVLEAPSWHRG